MLALDHRLQNVIPLCGHDIGNGIMERPLHMTLIRFNHTKDTNDTGVMQDTTANQENLKKHLRNQFYDGRKLKPST